MNVLVVADESYGALSDLTFELISAGATLGSVTVLVVAREPERLTSFVSRDGVSEVALVPVEETQFDIDIYRHALEETILRRHPDVTLLASTVNGRSVGAAVAAKLGLGFASDVHTIRLQDQRLVIERSFYLEKAIGELEFTSRLGTLLLLRPGAWSAATGTSSPLVTSEAITPVESRTRHVEYVTASTDDDVDISQADVILAIGRGIRSQENVAMMQRLADRMGVALAGTRPLIDSGWLPVTRLVGQSGTTVNPRVYLAFGVSGAVQHMSGIKGTDTIVAINRDETAAIFEVAHHGAVMDLFEVVEELERLYPT